MSGERGIGLTQWLRLPFQSEYHGWIRLSTEEYLDLIITSRIIEDEIESAIEARNEALQNIRELGPPDLVHLVKQTKSGGRQVCT